MSIIPVAGGQTGSVEDVEQARLPEFEPEGPPPAAGKPIPARGDGSFDLRNLSALRDDDAPPDAVGRGRARALCDSTVEALLSSGKDATPRGVRRRS